MELKIHDQEVHIQRYWLNHGLQKQEYTTLAGSKVEILHVGNLNHDAGPDFRDAVIRLDGRLLRGDIEIHLDSSGWYAHNHASDPAYNNVILHVVCENPADDVFIEREDGIQVHQIIVNDVREMRDKPAAAVADEFKKVDNCLLSRKPETIIRAAVQRTAEQRFKQRVAQLKEDLSWTSWEQLLFIRICEALGYSKNQTPFRKLAERLHFEKIRQVMQWVPEDVALDRCAALLFGTAGLLDNKHLQIFIDSDKIRSWLELWNRFQHTMQIKPMHAWEWQFFRLRPNNFPTRRIAGLVLLLHRFSKTGFIDGFSRIIKTRQSNRKRLTALQKALVVGDENRFHCQESCSAQNKPALIGTERAKDMVINLILPGLYLFFELAREGRFKNCILECYLCSPKLSDNTITRIMCEQLKIDTWTDGAISSASSQQGLYYLYKNYCRHEKCQVCLQMLKLA